MKKYTIFVLTLILCSAFFVGCGCMNSNADNTTVPTTKATTAPTTAPTTAATTVPTTAPTTEAPTQATDSTDMFGDTNETAGKDGMVDQESTGETGNDRARSRQPIAPLG